MIVGYISGQKLELVAPTVVSDTINYLTTKFVFEGEVWTPLDKFVFFTKGDETYCLPLDEDRTKPEDGLNLPDGVWMVNVVGLKYDEDMHVQTQITTTACPITVSKAVAVDGPGFPDVPESVAQKIMKIIGDTEALDTTEKDNLVAAINEVLHGERDTQTDYDENDENNPAYMKNRPFYEIPWEYTYNRTLTMSDLSAGPGPYRPDFRTAAYYILGTRPDFTLGITFDTSVTIIDQDGGLHVWGGTKSPRTLTADDLPIHRGYAGRKGLIIGMNDLKIVITDNGYFLVEKCPFEEGTTLGSMRITCRSSAVHTKLKLIDEKFIPEIDYNKLKNKPSIPTTETVTAWGFAKQEDVAAAKSKADLANTKADHALEIADGAEQDSYEAKGDAQNALDFARQAQATANNADQRSLDAIWQLASKQNTLVSGENVKTINGKSILGSGNIEVEGGGGVSDVQVDGASILVDGVANFKLDLGLGYNANGLCVVNPNNNAIQRRLNNIPLTPAALDYSVKTAMCDGKGAAWTEDEQKAAQQRLGILSVEEVLF